MRRKPHSSRYISFSCNRAFSFLRRKRLSALLPQFLVIDLQKTGLFRLPIRRESHQLSIIRATVSPAIPMQEKTVILKYVLMLSRRSHRPNQIFFVHIQIFGRKLPQLLHLIFQTLLAFAFPLPSAGFRPRVPSAFSPFSSRTGGEAKTFRRAEAGKGRLRAGFRPSARSAAGGRAAPSPRSASAPAGERRLGQSLSEKNGRNPDLQARNQDLRHLLGLSDLLEKRKKYWFEARDPAINIEGRFWSPPLTAPASV